jgi:DNA polymerase phi
MHSPLVAGAVLLELCQAVDDATLAGLVGGAQAPLAAWLTAPPADASPDALLLALRLWPRLPAAAAEACPLLPAGFAAKKLPAQLFTDPSASAGSKAVAAAAAAFFSKQHLTSLLPVLRGTTQSHPRLHSVWPTLLALLIPGFTADKVRNRRGSAAGAAVLCSCLLTTVHALGRGCNACMLLACMRAAA